MQIRAALLGQLVSLVYGKSSARLSVVEALKAALNENTLILSGDTTDSALNRQIAEALAGDTVYTCSLYLGAVTLTHFQLTACSSRPHCSDMALV